MRHLTFVSFLEFYLRDVSGTRSLSIHKLSKLAKKNYRIISSLILYCVFSNKVKSFYKYFDKDKYQDVKDVDKRNFLDERFKKYDFEKIYIEYIRKTKTKTYENQTKSLIRENIIKMMGDKKISKYRIYTDLKLNPGNVNCFLANDDPSKVSLSLVKKIYEFCNNY